LAAEALEKLKGVKQHVDLLLHTAEDGIPALLPVEVMKNHIYNGLSSHYLNLSPGHDIIFVFVDFLTSFGGYESHVSKFSNIFCCSCHKGEVYILL
jgi:hypothetical protein